MLCFKKVQKSEKNCLFSFSLDRVNHIWVSLIFSLAFETLATWNSLEIKVTEFGHGIGRQLHRMLLVKTFQH